MQHENNVEQISSAEVNHTPVETKTATEEAYKGDPRASNYEYRDGFYILPLERPFKYAKREIKELQLRKPRARNMKHLSAEPTFGEMMKIVYDISNEPRALMDLIDMSDMAEAIEFVGKFF